ncbi:MAG: HD domain-containing protein [Thermomicrobiales bacterium]|nr:HD domain-containing protein [Thermomicrobiales bacterium]MCO5223284.1 HD domain-containing protein [Thermomicrobiales bacterium]
MSSLDLSPEIVDAIGRLKELHRSGWLDRGIPVEDAESVADHSFGVAFLVWVLAPESIDRSRAVELALVHDLAEAVAGDATPYDREKLQSLDPDTRRNWLNQRHIRTDEQTAAKRRAETTAIETLAAALSEPQRDRLRSCWNELQARSTAEAQFVKEMDLLETWVQSRRYASRYPDAPMESFELEARDRLGSWELGSGS